MWERQFQEWMKRRQDYVRNAEKRIAQRSKLTYRPEPIKAGGSRKELQEALAGDSTLLPLK